MVRRWMREREAEREETSVLILITLTKQSWNCILNSLAGKAEFLET